MVLAFLLLVALASGPEVSRPDAGADAGPAEAGAPPTGAACPAREAELRPGSACGHPGQSCTWGASQCACRPTQCTSAAGPIPGCKVALVWECRKDGCPVDPPSGQCSSEGKTCDYDDNLCGSGVRCEKGRWRLAYQSCRPAAPPHRE